MKKRTLAILLGALCCVAALTLARPAEAQRNTRQTINGTMVGIGGRRAGVTLPFRLIVNNYTSPGEVQALSDAIARGEDELLDTLDDMNAGRISIGNNVGVTANAVIRTPQAEGGTKLTILYQRAVNFFELRRGTRSADYRFGYAEIFLDSRGRGEGTFIPAARVRLRGGDTWEVEDFGVFPARLIGLRSSGGVPAR